MGWGWVRCIDSRPEPGFPHRNGALEGASVVWLPLPRCSHLCVVHTGLCGLSRLPRPLSVRPMRTGLLPLCPPPPCAGHGPRSAQPAAVD